MSPWLALVLCMVKKEKVPFSVGRGRKKRKRKRRRWPDGCKVVKLNKSRLTGWKEVPGWSGSFPFHYFRLLSVAVAKNTCCVGIKKVRIKFQSKAEKQGFSLLQKYPKKTGNFFIHLLSAEQLYGLSSFVSFSSGAAINLMLIYAKTKDQNKFLLLPHTNWYTRV